jgi:hypothetical protein
MKFEYELKYDFVTGALSFEVTKMEESLRCKGEITSINGYAICSYSFPELKRHSNNIYLRGSEKHKDNVLRIIDCTKERACEIAQVLKEFQSWVETECKEPEVVMTIAEIKEKLGIKNLKIRKENN